MADKERLTKVNERLTKVNERLTEGSERLAEAGECVIEAGAAPSAAGGHPAAGARLICASGELAEVGDGVRFELEWKGETTAAFAVRYGGTAHAYINRCGHIAMELDWKPGKFFDAEGEYLICSTHGALYAPQSGACRGGPCRGAGLVKLEVFEADGGVYLKG